MSSAILGTGVVVGQDPSFEYPAIQPTSKSSSTTITCPEEQAKRVTVRFKQASVEEVLDWLGNQGVNFVTVGIPKGTKIDLNVSDMPVDKVVQVIATTLGGAFEKQGDTYIFQKGAHNAFGVAPALAAAPGTYQVITPAQLADVKIGKMPEFKYFAPEGTQFREIPGMAFYIGQRHSSDHEGRDFHEQMLKEFGIDTSFMKQMHEEMQKSDGRKLTPEQRKKLESMEKEMHKRFGPGSDFEKRMRVFGEQKAKEMQKRFGPGSDFEREMKAFGEQRKMSPEMAKEMEQRAKEMQKLLGPGSDFERQMKAFGEQRSKMSPEIAKEMEQRAKEMQKLLGPGSDFERQMRAFGEQRSKMTPEMAKEMEKRAKEMELRFGKYSDFAKQMEKRAKEMEQRFGKDSDFSKEMKAFKIENGKMRELTAKEREAMMKDLQIRMKDLKEFSMPALPKIADLPVLPRNSVKGQGTPQIPALPAVPARVLGRGDISELAKSLTPAQREKNKSQGFLYWSDLNKEQQAKLGASTWSGNWIITYSRDGESFTIKSDPKK
ncbi:MAG TPA: hypothetical protein VJ835_06380 [Fimbriimonadaceae bacterium]|nr:hypothetical protein [Fimbriimonadaceae bacterium]